MRVNPCEGKRLRAERIFTAEVFAGAERGLVSSTSEQKWGDLQALEVFPDAWCLCTL